MTDEAVSGAAAREAPFNRGWPCPADLAVFVLVVDTSNNKHLHLRDVQDLGTTVAAVVPAIALEAFVSAAFILIGGKMRDLFGRKRAYVLGLLVLP